MYYFAYGSNLNTAAIAEWCKHHGHRPPTFKSPRPAILDNYRLCFPVFSEYWGGGTADIVYDPGKYVAGALFELGDHEMKILDQKVARRVENDRETGTYKRINITVSLLGRSDPIPAVTYQGVSIEKYHIPPTKPYMDSLLQGAYNVGLSMMWVAYLQSFSIQEGRAPRPPK